MWQDVLAHINVTQPALVPTVLESRVNANDAYRACVLVAAIARSGRTDARNLSVLHGVASNLDQPAILRAYACVSLTVLDAQSTDSSRQVLDQMRKGSEFGLAVVHAMSAIPAPGMVTKDIVAELVSRLCEWKEDAFWAALALANNDIGTVEVVTALKSGMKKGQNARNPALVAVCAACLARVDVPNRAQMIETALRSMGGKDLYGVAVAAYARELGKSVVNDDLCPLVFAAMNHSDERVARGAKILVATLGRRARSAMPLVLASFPRTLDEKDRSDLASLLMVAADGTHAAAIEKLLKTEKSDGVRVDLERALEIIAEVP
jgi:hypothetical protein